MPRHDHLADRDMILLSDDELRAGETEARVHRTTN
jgi:hypothetical protein